MATDYTPVLDPANDVTYRATTAIKAGTPVQVTGDSAVGTAPAGTLKFAGIALTDAAINDQFPVKSNGVHKLKASGPIVAGDRVAVGANGTVATATTATIGLAVKGATDGGLAYINLNL
jgi:hypothetical protein